MLTISTHHTIRTEVFVGVVDRFSSSAQRVSPASCIYSYILWQWQCSGLIVELDGNCFGHSICMQMIIISSQGAIEAVSFKDSNNNITRPQERPPGGQLGPQERHRAAIPCSLITYARAICGKIIYGCKYNYLATVF